MTYSSLSKRFHKHSYFCGWYFRCQSDKQTLAIIPSVHKTKDSVFCTMQVITDTHAFHVQFPYDDLFLSRKIVIEWWFCVLEKEKEPIIRAQ